MSPEPHSRNLILHLPAHILATVALAALISLAVTAHPTAHSQAAGLWLASHSPAGLAANDDSAAASISADGRWVAFESAATDLVAGDTNGVVDIFLFDRTSGSIRRVSRSAVTADGQAAARSVMPALSGDGRWLAFRSDSALTSDPAPWGGLYLSDLDTGDLRLIAASDEGGRGANDFPAIDGTGARVVFESTAGLDGTARAQPIAGRRAGIFVWERATGTLRRASPAAADADAREAAISFDGSTVAFTSAAGNLVLPAAGAAQVQVFVVTLDTAAIARVSISTAGDPGNGTSRAPTLSGDGRLVAFGSLATNLVAKDVNGVSDIFLHDRGTGGTIAITDVVPGNSVYHPDDSNDPVLSADGRWLAFASAMYTLVPDDRNRVMDIYVRDLSRTDAGALRRVSLAANGSEGDRPSWAPALAAGGSWVAFTSSSRLADADGTDNDDIYLRDLGASTGHPAATATPDHGQPPHPTAAPTDSQHATATSDPHHPTATVHPEHPTATVHPDHPTATGDPHHPTATTQPDHPTATVHPEHPTATVHPDHPTATVDPHHPTATTDPDHPTATIHPDHSTATDDPHHPTATSPHNPHPTATPQQHEPPPSETPSHGVPGRRDPQSAGQWAFLPWLVNNQ